MLLELCWSMVWRTRLHHRGRWINNELSAAVSAEGVHGRGTDREHKQESGRGKMRRKRGKSLLQGLKPVESTLFASAPFEAQDELKHRPPGEKTFPRPEEWLCYYGTILAAQPPPGASLTFSLVVLLTCVLVIL
jgi:hypothetical protein